MSLEQRQNLVDWQVAPAQHEISNYDHVKINYRKSVEDKINSFDLKALRRMVFYTISTNVMCADKTTTPRLHTDNVDPINRDTYYPLEICLVRSSVTDHKTARDERKFKILHWIINPGPPPTDGSVKDAMDHKSSHKIDYSKFKSNDVYVESDLRKIVKEINAFLGPDRTVYSMRLKNCRQDLGCLKWLNNQVYQRYGTLMKPIKVYSFEDLFVTLNRKLFPDNLICLGVVQMKLDTTDTYNPEIQCRYHQDLLKEDEDLCTAYCAMAVATCYTNILLDEIADNKALEEDNAASAVRAAGMAGY